MALFTNLTVTLLSEVEETKTAEGVEVYQVKSMNEGLPDSEVIPALLMMNKNHEHASDFKKMAALTKKDTAVRLLVSGIMEYVLPVKDEKTKEITKGARLNVYLISIRRISLDTKVQPASAHVYGSGFVEVITEYENEDERKPELNILAGVQSLEEAGKYTSRLQVVGDKKLKTDEICMRVNEGQEVYFAGSLFKLKGVFKGKPYDKIKANVHFIEETDRIKSMGGRRNKRSASMASQVTDTFEESESAEEGKSVSELAKLAGIALDDIF